MMLSVAHTIVKMVCALRLIAAPLVKVVRIKPAVVDFSAVMITYAEKIVVENVVM